MAKSANDSIHALPSFSANLDDSPGILVQTGETLLFGWTISNNDAAAAYVQCFDAAALTDVTLGTTVADYVIPNVASGIAAKSMYKPMYFALGLCIFCTTDATGSTAGDEDVSLEYT